MKRNILLAAASLALAACQENPDRLTDDATVSYDPMSDNLEVAESYETAADNLEALASESREEAADNLEAPMQGGNPLGDTGTYSSPYATGLTYAGDPCTIDCSGHEAGYEWAEEQGISDPDDCGGKSDSFIEGCVAYAEGREPEEESSEESYEE